jgi:hypothetical protein
MNRFSIINVSNREDGFVSGNWVVDVTGTLEEARERLAAINKANSNRLDLAVVEFTNGFSQFQFITKAKELKF